MGFMDKIKGAAEKVQAAMPVGASGEQIEQANRANKLAKVGVETPARIDTMTPTGKTDATASKEYDVKVTVSPEGADPYETTIRQYVHPSAAEAFVAGAAVKVRVDPDDRTQAVLWGGA